MKTHSITSFWAVAMAAMMLGLSCSQDASGTDVVREVIKLLKADVGEAVVLAYIEKEGAPAGLNADAIVELRRAGATEKIILALMGVSGAGTASGENGCPFDLDERHTVKKPVVHGALAVYPIIRKGPALPEEYITLDEAVKNKTITIREKGDGSVPVVIVVNTGRLPIYISAGEIIIGGKQDRVVAYDVIVRPGREMPIEVRCVEHGRWGGSRMDFDAAPAMAGRAAKMAAQFEGQQAVWERVAEQNAALKAESSTGSYKASLSKLEVDAAYREFAAAVLPSLQDGNVAGMVVALNGKVHAIDMFSSPSLFARLKEKLLKGYLLDALAEGDSHAPPPGPDAIRTFYAETLRGRTEELKSYEANRNIGRESEKAKASECIDPDGEVLHRSLLSK